MTFRARQLVFTLGLCACSGTPSQAQQTAPATAVAVHCAPTNVARYRLGFDLPAEAVEKGACYGPAAGSSGCVSDWGMISAAGREGSGVTLPSGFIALPGDVFNPYSGSVSFWLKAESAFGQHRTHPILDSDPMGSSAPASRFQVEALIRGGQQFLKVHLREPKQTSATTATIPLPAWPSGQWRALTITWNNRLVVYLDGQPVWSGHRPRSGHAELPQNLYLLGSNRIGAPKNGDGAFTVDGLRFYNGALSVNAAAEFAAAPPIPSPIVNFTFDQENELSLAGACHQLPTGACVQTLDVQDTAPGRSGLAAKLTKGYLKVPIANALTFDQGTVSFWVGSEDYVGGSNGYFRLLDSDKGTGANAAWQLYLGKNLSPNEKRKLQFTATEVLNLGNNLHTPIDAWYPGDWHRVTLSWDGTKVRLYIDGQLRREQARSSTFPSGNSLPAYLYLLGSGRQGNALQANGKFRLDDFRTWSVALSETQIAELFTRERHETSLVVSSDRASMALTGPMDGFGLAALWDPRSCVERTITAPGRTLWKVRFEHKLDPSKVVHIENTAAFHANTSVIHTAVGATMNWRDIPLPDSAWSVLSGAEHFSVSVRLTEGDANDELRGLIRVIYDGDEWALTEVVFPSVKGVVAPEALNMPDATVGQRYPWPAAPGSLLPKVLHTNTYPSRQMHMQWLGLSMPDQKDNVYLGTYDTEGWIKTFDVDKSTPDEASIRGLDLQVRTPAPRPSSTPSSFYSYEPGWPAVIALMDGDWYAQARRYREDFALTRPEDKGPWSTNPNAPDWLLKAGMVTTGSSELLSTQISNSLDALEPDADLLLLLRNRWDAANGLYPKQSQDNDSPDLTPFDLTSSLQDDRFSTHLYFNPTIWDQAYDCLLEGQCCAPPWGGLDPEDVAVLDAQGAPLEANNGSCAASCGPYSEPCRNQVYTCPAAQAWRDRITDRFSDFFGTVTSTVPYPAIDGIYMDVVATYQPRICHATDHGHAPGGGAHWTQGHIAMLDSVRSAVSPHRPKFGMTSESFSDAYVGVLDGFLTWDAIVPRPLPLSPAVYHDRAVFYGISTLEHEGFPAQLAKQALLFSWGGTPGYPLFNIYNAGQEDFRSYLFKLARLHRHFEPWTVFGDMLAPPEIQSYPGFSGAPGLRRPAQGAPLPELTIPVRNEAAALVGLKTQAVVGNAFLAPSGKVGVLVVSTQPASSGTTPIRFAIDRVAWGLSGEALSIQVQDIDGVVWSQSNLTANADLALEVPPEGVYLVIIAPL